MDVILLELVRFRFDIDAQHVVHLPEMIKILDLFVLIMMELIRSILGNDTDHVTGITESNNHLFQNL